MGLQYTHKGILIVDTSRGSVTGSGQGFGSLDPNKITAVLGHSPDFRSFQITIPSSSNTDRGDISALAITQSNGIVSLGIGTSKPVGSLDIIGSGSTPPNILLRTNEDGIITLNEETGKIKFVIESGSFALSNDTQQLTQTISGSTAEIFSRVTDITSGGVRGSLVFGLSKDSVSSSIDALALGFNEGPPELASGDIHAVLSGSIAMNALTPRIILAKNDGTQPVAQIGSVNSSNLNEGSIILRDSAANDDGYFVIRKGQNSFLTGNGNLGIGTSSPSTKLSVSGSISASGDVIASRLITSGSTTNSGLVFEHNGGLTANRINLTSAQNMQFRAGGAFQFASSVQILDNKKLQFNTEGNASKAKITATSGSVPGQVRLDIEDASNSPKVSIITSGSSGLEGNVGIGTTNPASPLHIFESSSGAGTGVGLTIENDGTGDAIAQFLLTGTKRWVMGIDNSDSNKFKIADSSNLNTDALFTIDGDGNVGIGTTSPGSLLSLAKGDATVYDSTDDDGQRNVGPTILLENTSSVSNTFGQILFDSDDSNQGIARIAFLDTGEASTDIAFVTEHTNTKSEKLRIASDGKVGIGTTSPRETLEVAGNIRAVGDVIAQRYIVSSSVSHITQSFSSGSTIFGDTLEDTHQFTGSLLLTGSLVADLSTDTSGERTPLVIDNDGNVTIANADFTTITATSVSGAIDAATGSFVTNDQTSSFFDNLGNHIATQDLDMAGNSISASLHITASGNISSSATSTGSFGHVFVSSSIHVGSLGGTTDSTGIYHSNGIPMMFHGNDPGVTPRFNFFGASQVPSGSFFQGAPAIIRSSTTDDLSIEPGRVFVSGALKLKPNSVLGNSQVAVEYEINNPLIVTQSGVTDASEHVIEVIGCESGSNYTEGVVKAIGFMKRGTDFTGAPSLYTTYPNVAACCIPVFRIPTSRASSITFQPIITYRAQSGAGNTDPGVITLPKATATFGINFNTSLQLNYDDSSIININGSQFTSNVAYGVSGGSTNIGQLLLNPTVGRYNLSTAIDLIDSDGKGNATNLFNTQFQTSQVASSLPTPYVIASTEHNGVTNLLFAVVTNTSYILYGDKHSPLSDTYQPSSTGRVEVLQSGVPVEVEVLVNYTCTKY
jgi:hypothetical protein